MVDIININDINDIKTTKDIKYHFTTFGYNGLHRYYPFFNYNKKEKTIGYSYPMKIR